jgi:hypothetical protein
MQLRASSAHACGFWHPIWRSLAQSLQMQLTVAVCGGSLWPFLSLADMHMMSTTIVTAWRWRRHLEGLLVIGRGFEAMWYQTGKCVLSSRESQIAARFT